MKKNIIIIILGVLVVGLGGYLVYDKVINKQTDEESNININSETDKNSTAEKNNRNIPLETENTNKYTYEQNDNGNIIFYKDGQKINEYSCTGIACKIDFFKFDTEGTVGNNLRTIIFGDKVLIAICDGKNCDWIDGYGGIHFSYNQNNENKKATGTVLLYDIPTGNIKEFTNITTIHSGDGNVKLLVYEDSNYELISYDGTITKKYNHDVLKLSCYEGCLLDRNSYNYKDNIIVTNKNGKYGIERINNGEVIIENKYDNIMIVNGYGTFDNSIDEVKYFVGKKDSVSDLYTIKDGKKVTKLGYDKIFMLDENTLLVYKDKYLSFKSLDEKDIIDNKIKIENLFESMPKNPYGVSVYINENSEAVIHIGDGTDISTAKYYEYKYNLKTKELTQV